MAKLRPRARLVRTIGDQLISGPEAALIELVKNSYDADATAVFISISPLSESGTGEIWVADDGFGMSERDILDKWLEPATDNKVAAVLSPKNRRLLGAKGIGRFATAKLGTKLLLTSLAAGESVLTEVRIDWEDFEKFRYLDEVDLDVRVKDAPSGFGSGVRLCISELRDQWSQAQLEKLIRELRRLISPVRESTGDEFKVFLDLGKFTHKENGFDGRELVDKLGRMGSVEEEDEDNTEIRPFSMAGLYHYSVAGTFDQYGKFEGVFTNRRANGQAMPLQFVATSCTEDEKPCGPLSIQLSVFDRESDAVQELLTTEAGLTVGKLEAKKILDENVGVGIYRSGFRIRPYGDVDHDWLELERARVQNPSRKLGLNQLWGMVQVADEKSSGLVERSSREGLEINGSYARLKRLVSELLVHVEALRVDFRVKANISRKPVASTATAKGSAELLATNKAVKSLPSQYQEQVRKALLEDAAKITTAIEELETYQQALASRSTLGLVVAQVLHDGRRFLGDISSRSKRLQMGAGRLLEKSEFGEQFRESFGDESSSIHESAAELGKLFRSLDPISGKKRGAPKLFDAVGVINKCLSLFSDRISDARIEILREVDASSEVYGYESDLLAALANITDNAIFWLVQRDEFPRKLSFKVSSAGKYLSIAISNNGPPINGHFVERLFTPGFTLKRDGSGIGLAIAQEAMRASKGDLAFDADNEDTCFVIEMRKARGD